MCRGAAQISGVSHPARRCQRGSLRKLCSQAQRDAVAKQVYSKIFDDVVAMMNETLSKGKQGGGKYIGALVGIIASGAAT